jgi:hypothetical protein
LLFVYSFTDHCHQVESQLQLINSIHSSIQQIYNLFFQKCIENLFHTLFSLITIFKCNINLT